MPPKLCDRWKNAKKQFDTSTAKNNPRPKLKADFTKSSPVEKALEKIDKAAAAFEKKFSGARTAASACKKAFDKYRTAGKKYIGVLTAAMNSENAFSLFKQEIAQLQARIESISSSDFGLTKNPTFTWKPPSTKVIEMWKDVKQSFETATGRKKPSEKLFGIFRKSSGMEAACEAMDSAHSSLLKKIESAKEEYFVWEAAVLTHLEVTDEYFQPLMAADMVFRDDVTKLRDESKAIHEAARAELNRGLLARFA